MNSQITLLTDMQSAEAKYRDLVIRINTAIEGENEDRQTLISVFLEIQKNMDHAFSRARCNEPSQKNQVKYDAFVTSFRLTSDLLDQSLLSLIDAPNVPQYTA